MDAHDECNKQRGGFLADVFDPFAKHDGRQEEREISFASLFRPLFSLAAHVARAWRESPENAAAGLTDVETVAAALWKRRRRFSAEPFTQAWFALCVWLDETLAAMRLALGEAASPTFRDRYFSGRDGTESETFFAHLEAAATAAQAGKPEAQAVLAVYELCLALGFRGPYREKKDALVLKRWRRRCRTAWCDHSLCLDAAHNNIPTSPHTKNATEKRFRMTYLLWLLPPSVTVALYFFYRTMLADLYASII